MHWVITWDGARLVVVQRASRATWFGVVATTVLALAWYPLARDGGAGWGAAGGGLLLFLAIAVALVAFNVRAYRRVEASEGIVRVGRWSVPATQVRILTVRLETRRILTQWGRGDLRVGTLFVGLVGGRTVDLVTVQGPILDGRGGRGLAAALAALPYGRPPR